MRDTSHKRLITAADAARRLGVNKSTASRWCQMGRLPAFKTPGGHWRVRAIDVEAMRADLPVYAEGEG
jgi:excisionase family DNA binding protein